MQTITDLCTSCLMHTHPHLCSHTRKHSDTHSSFRSWPSVILMPINNKWHSVHTCRYKLISLLDSWFVNHSINNIPGCSQRRHMNKSPNLHMPFISFSMVYSYQQHAIVHHCWVKKPFLPIETYYSWLSKSSTYQWFVHCFELLLRLEFVLRQPETLKG